MTRPDMTAGLPKHGFRGRFAGENGISTMRRRSKVVEFRIADVRPRTPAANRYRERFRVAQELLIGVIRSVPNAPPPTSGSSCRDCAGQAPGRVKKDGERTAPCEGELLHLIANGFREPSSQAPPRTLCLQRGQTARGLGQDVHPCPAASSARWPGRRCRESTIGSPAE